MEKTVDERAHPRVQIVRTVVGGVVQAVGIGAIALMELVALQQNVDGTLLVPIVGVVSGLVGLRARDTIDAFSKESN